MKPYVTLVTAAAVLLVMAPGNTIASGGISKAEFKEGTYPGEAIATFELEPEVRVQINKGPQGQSNATPLLVFYALPNGNTIEETVGKVTSNTNEWRFNIQHIGAQTRFLRNLLPDRRIVVAYLEAKQKSWPAWRKKHGNEKIPPLLMEVAAIAGCDAADWALNGHSGGGSLIFGFINAATEIPARVKRIAFLDSNYAYDNQAGHLEKLVKWLGVEDHFLCVLAYNDAAGLLNGKPFVSASGGTWGRSHAMWKDFSTHFEFSEKNEGDLKTLVALDGRLQLYLMENPKRAILHTVQVERNGFIHSMVCGTTNQSKGYLYYAEPAWRQYAR